MVSEGSEEQGPERLNRSNSAPQMAMELTLQEIEDNERTTVPLFKAMPWAR
jgi:hypothetical protein